MEGRWNVIKVASIPWRREVVREGNRGGGVRFREVMWRKTHTVADYYQPCR